MLYVHANKNSWSTSDDRCSSNALVKIRKEVEKPVGEFLLEMEEGNYAIMLVDDKDDDGKLDTNFIGMPTEGCGASNGASGGAFGGPKWKDAKFQVACGEETYVQINLWKA
jgi:uncharacterized protein (DUF2141 family)